MSEEKERWIAETRDGWYAVGEGNIEIAYCKDKDDAILLKNRYRTSPRHRRKGEPCTLIMFSHGASVQIYRTGQRGAVAGRTSDSKIIINGEDGQIHKFHPNTRAIPLEEIVNIGE